MKKTLIALLFTPLSVFAVNPPQCLPASLVHYQAQLGQFHFSENLQNCKDAKLNTWYLDSIQSNAKELAELKQYNDWKVGRGKTGPHGYAISCDYYSPSLPANDNDVYIDEIFSYKICRNKLTFSESN